MGCGWTVCRQRWVNIIAGSVILIAWQAGYVTPTGWLGEALIITAIVAVFGDVGYRYLGLRRGSQPRPVESDRQ